jgi:hypothetical protein
LVFPAEQQQQEKGIQRVGSATAAKQQEKGIQRVGSATAAAPAAGKLAEPTKGLAGEYKAAQQENGKTNGWLCNNF